MVYIFSVSFAAVMLLLFSLSLPLNKIKLNFMDLAHFIYIYTEHFIVVFLLQFIYYTIYFLGKTLDIILLSAIWILSHINKNNVDTIIDRIASLIFLCYFSLTNLCLVLHNENAPISCFFWCTTLKEEKRKISVKIKLKEKKNNV